MNRCSSKTPVPACNRGQVTRWRASVEGAVAASTGPKPTAVYTVSLFGPSVDVVYVGPSPGSLSSVIQINLRVPSIPAGSLPAGSALHAALTILPAGENYVSQLVWVAAR